MLMELPIKDTELPVRIKTRLICGRITTVGDLLTRTERDISRLPGVGKETLDDVKALLDRHGLSLKAA